MLTREQMKSLLQQAWSEVFQTDKVEDSDDFFEKGGDSIKAVQLSAWLIQKGVKLDLADIFTNPKLGELVGKLTETDPMYVPDALLTKEIAAKEMQGFFPGFVPPQQATAAPQQPEAKSSENEQQTANQQVCTPNQQQGNSQQVCTPENNQQVCTPENNQQVCTPENSQQVCTPNNQQVCTPNQQQVCTPSQQQVCTPSQQQVCTPNQQQVCTPNPQQVCTPNQQVCTPNQQQVCTPFIQMGYPQFIPTAVWYMPVSYPQFYSMAGYPGQMGGQQVCTPTQPFIFGGQQVCTPTPPMVFGGQQVCAPAPPMVFGGQQVCTPAPPMVFGGQQVCTPQQGGMDMSQGVPPQLEKYLSKKVDSPIEKPNVIKIEKAKVGKPTVSAEQALMTVMQGLLPDFDRSRDFFEQGLTSFDTVKMVTRCAENGYAIQMKDIYMHSNFDELVKCMQPGE